MLKYIARRLIFMIIVVLCVTIMTFSIIYMVPGDPAEMIAMARYGIDNLIQDNIERIRHAEGLDAPIYVQYVKWLNHVLHGDFGCSLVTGAPVLSEILTRFPATVKLAIAGMMVSLLISIPIGIISAVKQNSLIDNLSMVGTLIGVSMPNFWLGLLLIMFFSLYPGIFPVCGYGGIRYIILPAVTLGTGMAAITTRLIRSSMIEVLKEDYITTARAKGLKEKSIIVKHALKNAFIPVITVIGLQLGHLLGGTVIIETIFAWPGVGKLLVDSIFARDFSLIQGCVLFMAVVFVLVNLVVDISYMYLDPRIRYEKGAE